MKKYIIKLATLCSICLTLFSSSYAYDIWNPIQYVKQLFATPNGETDLSKATIKIDGTKWIIDVSSWFYINGQPVPTINYLNNKISDIIKKVLSLPKCGYGEVLTSQDGKSFKCIKVALGKIDWKCWVANGRWFENTPTKSSLCIAGVSVRKDNRGNDGTFNWICKWENWWKDMACSAKKYLYNWSTSSWSSCNVRCGNGYKTRKVVCKRNDGVVVADRFCSWSKPVTRTSCYAWACGSWHYSRSLGFIKDGRNYKENRVINIYNDLFNRYPERSALNYWVGQINQWTIQRVSTSRLATRSLPFVKYSSNYKERLVIGIYNSVFNRYPSRSDINYWVGQMNSHNRSYWKLRSTIESVGRSWLRSRGIYSTRNTSRICGYFLGPSYRNRRYNKGANRCEKTITTYTTRRVPLSYSQLRNRIEEVWEDFLHRHGIYNLGDTSRVCGYFLGRSYRTWIYDKYLNKCKKYF